MVQSNDGTYIYLIVPEKYNVVYEQLLAKLSDLGIDMIKDCGATCRGINRAVINCWNMFQAACAAYSTGEEKRADLLINYINGQLNLKAPEYGGEDGSDENYVDYYYYGTNEDIIIDNIVLGNKTTNKTTNVKVDTKVIWIAIPKDNKLIIDNANLPGDYFYNLDAGYDNKFLIKEDIVINEKEYVFYKFTYFININMNLTINISK